MEQLISHFVLKSPACQVFCLSIPSCKTACDVLVANGCLSAFRAVGKPLISHSHLVRVTSDIFSCAILAREKCLENSLI